jgi:hypothetical protein
VEKPACTTPCPQEEKQVEPSEPEASKKNHKSLRHGILLDIVRKYKSLSGSKIKKFRGR